jgi:flagellar biosynthesis protein
VREEPALVEALSRLELEQEIPPELFVAVAEVLVWAYGLEAKRRPTAPR